MKNLFLLLFLANMSNVFSQVQIGNTILASEPDDGTGDCVGISADGQRVVFGSPGAEINGTSGVGSARVYELTGSTWAQIGQTIEGSNQNEWFGGCVDISNDGNRIVVGGKEKIQVYEWNNGSWIQLGSNLVATNLASTYILEFSNDGNTLSTGIYTYPFSVGVIVYEFVGNDWMVKGNPFGGLFDFESAISGDGNRIAIEHDLSDVKIFDYQNNTWTQVGNDIENPNGYLIDFIAMSDSGDRIFIYEDYNIFGDSTALRTYELVGANWEENVPPLEFNEEIDKYRLTQSSWAASADGKTIVFASSDDTYIDYNDVRVYKEINGNWVQYGQAVQIWAHDEQAKGHVDITPDGDTFVVGCIISDESSPFGGIKAYDISSGATSILDYTLNQKIKVSPNPTSGKIFLSTEIEVDSQFILRIHNVLGQLTLEQTISTGKTEIDLIGEPGLFFLTIENQFGLSKAYKILKY